MSASLLSAASASRILAGDARPMPELPLRRRGLELVSTGSTSAAATDCGRSLALRERPDPKASGTVDNELCLDPFSIRVAVDFLASLAGFQPGGLSLHSYQT